MTESDFDEAFARFLSLEPVAGHDRYHDLDDRFYALVAIREAEQENRTDEIAARTGASPFLRDDGLPSQGMRSAAYAALDETAVGFEDAVEDLQRPLNEAIRAQAPLADADLDELEGELRDYARHLKVGFDTLVD